MIAGGNVLPGILALAVVLTSGVLPSHAQDAGIDALPLAQEREIRAQLSAPRAAVLSSEIAGRIETISVRDGDRFEAGQVLVRFDCAANEARLAQARAEHAKRVRVQEVNDRLKKLGSVSLKELAIGEADVDAAAAEVKAASILVDRCVIRAPFAGRVAGLSAREHQFTPEGQPLVDILDDGELEIETIVPSRWLGWLRIGSPFEIAIEETQRIYPASVTRISGRVDAVSQSIKIYAKVSGSGDGLMAGMSGSAVFAPPGQEK